jgi:CheY-like chemotaxis protein
MRDGREGAPAGVAVRVPDDRPDHHAKLAEVARLLAAARQPEPTFRILLVEDNALVAQMYAAALRRLAETDKVEGLGVEVVNDGAAAWDRLVRAPRVDLLITDVFMPLLTGTDLIERMRQEPVLAQLPVVVITSGGEKERDDLKRLGVTLFLQKPVKYVDLADTVRFIVRARQGKVTSPPRAAVQPPKGATGEEPLTTGTKKSDAQGTKTPAPRR